MSQDCSALPFPLRDSPSLQETALRAGEAEQIVGVAQAVYLKHQHILHYFAHC